MSEWAKNWEAREAEYYKQFDPYDEYIICDMCEAEERDLCICNIGEENE